MPAPRRVKWDDTNRRHLLVDHADRGMTEDQVTYAIEHADEINVADDLVHGTTVALCRIDDRVLAVAWMTLPDGRCYPVHAHWAGRRERGMLQ